MELPVTAEVESVSANLQHGWRRSYGNDIVAKLLDGKCLLEKPFLKRRDVIVVSIGWNRHQKIFPKFYTKKDHWDVICRLIKGISISETTEFRSGICFWLKDAKFNIS